MSADETLAHQRRARALFGLPGETGRMVLVPRALPLCVRREGASGLWLGFASAAERDAVAEAFEVPDHG